MMIWDWTLPHEKDIQSQDLSANSAIVSDLLRWALAFSERVREQVTLQDDALAIAEGARQQM